MNEEMWMTRSSSGWKAVNLDLKMVAFGGTEL